MYIKLKCRSCGRADCEFKPLGSWSNETEGCLKHATQEEINMFRYYIEERRPFLKQLAEQRKGTAAMYDDWIEFKEMLENKPTVNRER